MNNYVLNLEYQNGELMKNNVLLEQDIARLQFELEQVKAERDAAIDAIGHTCETCSYAKDDGSCEVLPDGDAYSPDYTEGFDRDDCGQWQWRGLRKEGTHE